MSESFPDLGDWHDTRRSLHAWSKLLSAVRGALGEPHPHWWHTSLTVTRRGLTTGPLGGDDPAAQAVELDLQRHESRVHTGDRIVGSLSLTELPAVDRLAGWLLDHLESERARAVESAAEKWRDDSPRLYDPAAAERYLRAVHASANVLAAVRDGIGGSRGPVQFWAHHFDVSFELFGDRLIAGEGEDQPSQIGFGFFPGDDSDPRAYFYGTPWPFAEGLLDTPLPPPASWQDEPWAGARLPYSAATANAALVGEFFRVVHASGRSVLGE